MQDYTSSIYQAIRVLFSIFCNENTKACLRKIRMIRYYIRQVNNKTDKIHDQKRCSYEYNNSCTLLNPLTFRSIFRLFVMIAKLHYFFLLLFPLFQTDTL